MTLGEVEQVLAETDHNGFPVIVSTESQYLVGFVLRRDLNLAIKAARNRFDAIPADTIVYFSSHGDGAGAGGAHTSNSPLRFARQPIHCFAPFLFLAYFPPVASQFDIHFPLYRIVDLAPVTITDKTPMETVVNMFQKLGLRQTLVTHNGRLLGIVTKKDVLRHIKRMDNEDEDEVLFN